MSKIINVKVSQPPKQVNTKFGSKTVCGFLNQETNIPKDQREIVVWRPPNDSELMSLKVGQHLRLLHDGKHYHLVNEPSNGNNGNSRINTPSSQSSYQPNRNASSLRSEGNGHYTHVNHQEDLEDLIHDVPMLSNLDKKKVARFIEQQARLYRYTVDTVAKQFPELVGVDERGIRSIALSLLINTNHMINRNL